MKKNSIKPIHVLQVIGSMNRGGAETMIMNLYRNIDKSMIQFDFLLSSKENGQYEEEINKLGGRIYHIKKFNGLNPVLYYNECKKFFKTHPEISIVHGHIGSSAAFYLKAAKKYGKYTIAHSHNSKSYLSIRSIVFSMYSYPTRKIADYLFGCSTEAGIARFGKKAVNSSVYSNFNNGINLNDFYFNDAVRINMKKELHITEDSIVVGTVGRITEQKNPDKILDIFENLVKIYSNVYCLWIGTGPDEDRIKSIINSKGLSDKVFLLGVRSDVHNVLHAFDCFVFPSLWEGLPVTIIEAQAAGLPIVISDKVSKEVGITPLVFWLNVDDNSQKWAEICFEKSCEFLDKRNSYKELVKNSGYDIHETSNWLMKFYLSKIDE